MKREASLSLTILYSDPHRRDEIGMTMIVEQAKAAAIMDHLEQRGFLIDKITVRKAHCQYGCSVTRELSPLGFGNCLCNCYNFQVTFTDRI
jgi:hypothetical protein